MTSLPPAIVLFVGAVAVLMLRGRVLQMGVLVVPALAGWAFLQLGNGSEFQFSVAGRWNLDLLHVDRLSRLFGMIFVIVTAIASIYALHVKRAGEHAAALFYAAGSLGVVFAGDWLTLFVFWELMAVSSVFLVFFRGDPAA